jgi:predicted nucleic acid-binding protein
VRTPRFVLDNSVVMSWCFENEHGDYGEAVLDSLGDGEAVVPAIWPLEVGNVLLVAERKGRLAKADSSHFLALLAELSIFIEQESPERMFGEITALARDQRLSTYDASYLDLAMRLGLPIASQDISLLRAARKCGVPAYTPRHTGRGTSKG